MPGVSDTIGRNAAYWDEKNANGYADAGRRAWLQESITWGQYELPESSVGALPDVSGLDVVELGCGTGYISAWLLRAGARSTVGLDPSGNQLASAVALGQEIGPPFPVVRAGGEQVPLRSSSFDLVISEYGAAIWADPYRWIPEAARLLRPGGELVFLGCAVLFMLCAPDAEEPTGRTLQRDQRGMCAVQFTGDDAVEYHLPHGDMIRLLRSSGFEVLDLIDLYAPDDAESLQYIDADWARRWPFEQIWRARKR